MEEQLIKELKKYVQDTLDIALVIQPWNDFSDLPFFLKDQYVFYRSRIMATPCILIVANSKQEITPAVIRKNIDLLQARTGKAKIIYIRRQLNSFNRKRLIEHKVSFIIPGNQMFLPFLGIDFREHFKKMHSQSVMLSPSAQVVLLHSLLRDKDNILRLNDLAKRYGYSVMTMSRAFNEIESLGLAEVTMQGRKREMILQGTRKEVWEKSQAVLRTPVTQRLYLDKSVAIKDGIYAGLSALARYSTLAEPANPIWAINSTAGRLLTRKYRAGELSSKDLNDQEIEVWSYDPKLFAAAGAVDRLSLFLSLREEKDERVEDALEKMMKEMPW